MGILKDELKIDLCHNDGSFVAHLNDSNKLIKEYFDFSKTNQMTLKVISTKLEINLIDNIK